MTYNDAMKDAITLKYSGKAVDDGRMDAYEVAGNIIAFTDYLVAVSKVAYGNEAKLKTEINAFSHGSFRVEFILDYAGILATLFAGVSSPKDIYDLIRDSFSAWKHLDGEPAKEITRQEDGQVKIVNNKGEVNIYRAEVINIVSSPEASAAVGRFVKKAVDKDIDAVHMEHNGTEIANANVSEARSFGYLMAQEKLTENVVEQWLMLESPTFKKGNKWFFSDGANSFYAAIEDAGFLLKVVNREVLFGQDDAFLVDLKIQQSGQPNALKVERTIVTVKEHRHAPKQSNIRFD